MVQYAHIQLQGGHGEDRTLQALPVPDWLTWVSEEVPKGLPFVEGGNAWRLSPYRTQSISHPDAKLLCNNARLDP